jgi:hypothetical protein
MKKIAIELPDYGVSAEAELHEDKAPETCKALLKVLPIETNALHGRWGGEEIWFSMPHIAIPKENQTVLPSRGEILLVEPAPGASDFAIFYGRGWCFSPEGFVPGNHFATIKSNLPAFAAAADRLLKEGSKRIVIRKL